MLFFFSKLKDWIPKFEVMTSLLAAMTHDLDHPGVNQTFLIKTGNHLANLYQVTDSTNHITLFEFIFAFVSSKPMIVDHKYRQVTFALNMKKHTKKTTFMIKRNNMNYVK